ncbi:MAG: hypothetical protein M3O28_05410 [Actinomycetota bacterium]|nr:hypothetical protein [Actinomycetota bacterium]
MVMVLDELIEALSASFPMIPYAMIAALTSDAVDWLEQAGDVASTSTVRPLVVEALELRLRVRRQ